MSLLKMTYSTVVKVYPTNDGYHLLRDSVAMHM